MHCGQGLAGVAPAAAHPTQMPMGQTMAAPAFPNAYANSGKKNTWIAVLTALCLVLAIFFGLKAAGILKVGGTAPKLASLKAEGDAPNQKLLEATGQTPDQKILKAEGETPNTPLLTAEGSTGPSTLQKTEITMPDDIRKWLEHLERIERRKNDLSLEQLGQMTVLMERMKVLGPSLGALGDDDTGDTPPAEEARGKFNDLKPEWNKLIADFRAYPPPAECKPIADNFYRAINEIPGMTSDIADILSSAASDPSSALAKAYKLQNTSGNVIDRYLGETDRGVADICEKYHTRKWFQIKTDVGGGLMGKFGI